ncbi:MAG: DNA polymerase III subunit epsilon [Rhodobacteraceae bacterium]|nr:DNA polymerase III subunit epsilon [Paracoccaceae bacterium]
MREISLDTETTGLDPSSGDRIVEIGCVEMINHVATDQSFHVYLDPKRPMSPEATEITGLTDEFLAGKPLFESIAQAFADFIGDDLLVIHNAPFDVKFINAEFRRVGLPPLDRNRVMDTLPMARKKFPGAQANLDALCRRFGIDNSVREKHGALLDAELLAEVYLELIGGRQPDFILNDSKATSENSKQEVSIRRGPAKVRQITLGSLISEDEKVLHQKFVNELGEEALWNISDFSKIYNN